MKKVVAALALGALSLGLVGCAGPIADPKQTAGTIIGGAAGAVLGSRIGHGTGRLAAVAVGTLLGAFAGSQIGSGLDKIDRMYAERAAGSALESGRSGEAVPWRNPDTGHQGSVTPQPAFQTAQGRYCREFQQVVTVGGRSEQAYGQACRQPDGTWEIVR